uniref:C-type lectin 1 n=1 Tax=Mytilus galloprovincialis TaxID=29158 RepID=A0A0C5PRJ3_MYTGA|nr:C-type lectin 1 [Mytilus galloprovincialis]
MKMWFIVIFSFMSYSCNGSLVDQSTQSSVNTELKGTDITKIKMEVDVMKGHFHALLLRVINNEHEIAFFKGQTQQLEHELENTKRTFSCEIEGLRDVTTQYEQELNETINAWNTFNETIQDLSHSVSVLDNKVRHLKRPGWHGIDSGSTDEPQGCHLGWIRNEKLNSCYYFSNTSLSWNDAQEQCGRKNGSLADIYSEDEFVWLVEYIRNSKASSFWIGGKDDKGEYKWFTADGQTKHLNYTRWALSEPLPYNNETHCITLWRIHQYRWAVFVCENKSEFICKTYL